MPPRDCDGPGCFGLGAASRMMIAIAITSLVAPGAARGQVALSNTPVTVSQLDALFPILFSPGVIDGGGDIRLGFVATYLVFAGGAGTAAEGLYLYQYRVDPVDSSTDGTAFRSLSVIANALVSIDIDGDFDAESSAYCTDCTSAPATPPDHATRTGDEVRWEFGSGFENCAAPLYLVSPVPPAHIFAQLETVTEEDAFQAVPEPRYGMAASAMAALSAGAWRRRGRKGSPRRRVP